MSASLRVMTLEALHEQIPTWRPDDKSHLYAIVDMGSNGIRFSITSLGPPSTRLLEPVYSSRAAVSLFDALTPSSDGLIFPSETMETVASALCEFRQLALAHGVPQSQIVILATEAMRRAANGGQMLEAIAAATGGLGMQILDPAVETLLGAVMGSRSGLVDVPKGALFLDLGGGSLQMTWVDTRDDNYEMDAARAGESLPYGAAKLTKLFQEQQQQQQQQSGTVQPLDLSPLQDGLARIYANLCARYPALRAIQQAHENGVKDASLDVYMCGGGFRGYGSILMHTDPISPYPIPSTNTYSVPGSQFKQTSKMRHVNEEYDEKIHGMSKRRRRQFPAIATVIEAFIAAVPNIRRVTFCGGSNRQGYLMMKMPREIRESNPLEVLANVTECERPIFDAVLSLFSASVPSPTEGTEATETRELEKLRKTHSILAPGLSALFIRLLWARAGRSAASNSSFALHDAVIRDPDCPGLTHLCRALLAVTLCARWGNDIGHADEILHKGCMGILESHDADVGFWALYLGAVANVIATLFPLAPTDVDGLLSSVKLNSVLSKSKTDKDRVELVITLSEHDAKTVNLDDLSDTFKKTTKLEPRKSKFKASVKIISCS
ncbi:hypothetical protein E4U56_004887 [Claviceps arundinis]|uniref:Retrograde regulation protein 2 n=1 Tax=Claviceps arundinis TaxID=1623583 RepID=A0A9P7MLG7_9HYPO|nr:hypothetical protein E4U56_004887 [Claviceps arundinis]